MKIVNQLVFIILFFVLTNDTFSQDKKGINRGYSLNGRIDKPYKGFVYLFYKNDDGSNTKDSSLVNNGHFYFKGKVNCYSGIVSLQLDGSRFGDFEDINATQIDIDNSDMYIEIKYNDFKDFKLVGCASHDLYKMKMKTLDDEIKRYNNLINKTSSALLKDSLNKLIRDRIKIFANKNVKFIVQNPNSNITPRILFEFKNSYSAETLLILFDSISDKQKNSFYGNRLKSIIDEIKSVKNQVGTVAPKINTYDINGVKLILDSITKHNYVLLDFWASWCQPCRASNPFLKRLYKEYHGKGLEIIGISDDDESESAWRNAVANDSTTIWKHVLRGRKKENVEQLDDINKSFYVNSIPVKILINKNGIIIGRYDSDIIEDVLVNKLKELFGE